MDVIIRGGLAGMIEYTICGLTNFILYSLGILPSTGIHYNAVYAVFFSAPGIPISSAKINYPSFRVTGIEFMVQV
ncbi:hypothetical protein [Desulfosporosinus sp.]|uniref:hypothetical protein n=1 Tax=Desulfosporosinus sp. TaxID=157907 RepID=UPI0023185CB2|nr:hypothetical protein [Desulfosporosinus sp.]MCO5384533.1 hypothetical protein [Desulfosporosinus sp.]MDA8220285.1 hypothetical protein [Desulfitobacterium hafniense]